MNPLIGMILGNVIEGALRGAFAQPGSINPSTIAAETVRRVGKDPVVVNQMNAEPAYKSRVVVGSGAALAAAIGAVLVQVATNEFPNYDWTVLGPALATVFGTGYALYGRLKSGLKPLFA